MHRSTKKSIEDIEPINKIVISEPHTPIYKMHRYFARRPYNVFNLLVEHYSNPNDIVLDPFMGGGVTVVESLRLGRKVIGVDLDPIAWFVTKTEVMDVDLNELRKAFGLLEKEVKKEINELYETKCPKCKKEVSAKWLEWSLVVECPNCKKNITLAETKKVGRGKYECYICKKDVPKSSKIIKEIPIRVGIECSYCQFNGDKPVDIDDKKLIQSINKDFNEIVEQKKLWFPKEEIPFGEKTQEAINLGYTHFSDLFTKRNLIALGLLLNHIENISDKNIRELIILAFSNSLRFATKLCFLAKEWRKGEPLEWSGHDYWPPSVPAEVNVWKYFVKCYKRVLKGKEYSKTEIGNRYKKANNFKELEKDKTCLLLNKSSTNLDEIPNASVDVIITDPPYGGNVQYSELSQFWLVWLKKLLNLNEPDIIEEAVINKAQHKNVSDYEELIYRVLKECHKKLKPNKWLVMTFHNRDPNVWISLHNASHRAGFEEVSRIYQPPIQSYTTTLHQRANGSLLGDFIVSFKWREKPIEEKTTIELPEENKIIEVCKKVIEFHFGATTSMLYRALIPMPFFYRIAVKDLVPIFKKYFIQKDTKWYLQEQFDITGNLKPMDIIPAEQRIETLLKSFLLEKPKTMDEIIQILLTTLPTEEYVEYEEVNKVLHRIAKKVKIPQKKRRGWVIETKKPLKRFIEEKIKVEEKISQYPIMKELVNIGLMHGFTIHIGISEQTKNPKFKKVSFPIRNVWGFNENTFEEIKNMDVIWLREDGKYIDSAFEVEVSAIDRELHKLSNLILNTDYNPKIKTYLVVPDNKKDYTIKTLNSPTFSRVSKIIKIKTFSEVKKGEL